MKNLKLAAILALALALGIIVLQNRDPVETRILFFTVTMPHVLLLALTTAGGFCLGLLVAMLVGVPGDDEP